MPFGWDPGAPRLQLWWVVFSPRARKTISPTNLSNHHRTSQVNHVSAPWSPRRRSRTANPVVIDPIAWGNNYFHPQPPASQSLQMEFAVGDSHTQLAQLAGTNGHVIGNTLAKPSPTPAPTSGPGAASTAALTAEPGAPASDAGGDAGSEAPVNPRKRKKASRA